MILKIKNADGEWVGVPALKGEKGDPGIGAVMDSEFSSTSENGVQNKVIKSALDGKADVDDIVSLGETSTTAYRGDRGKTAYTHSQTSHAPSNAQANVIETVKVNGTALTPSSKAVDVTVPTNTSIVDLVYPVGSIYMSVNSTSPAVLFGGNWEALEDRFLLGASSNHVAGEMDGAETVTLTAEQSGVPSHTHGMSHTHSHSHNLESNRKAPAIAGSNTWSSSKVKVGTDSSRYYISRADGDSLYGVTGTDTDATASSKSATDSNSSANASESHNNMPPYLSVYMWKRIA